MEKNRRPKKPVKEKMGDVVNKIKNDEKFNRGVDWLWQNRFSLFCVVLMIIGLMFSLVHFHLGGILIGLSFGLAFKKEIYNLIFKIKGYYIREGIYKTLLIIGVCLYLFFALPVFWIATALGFLIIFLFLWLKDKE